MKWALNSCQCHAPRRAACRLTQLCTHTMLPDPSSLPSGVMLSCQVTFDVFVLLKQMQEGSPNGQA